MRIHKEGYGIILKAFIIIAAIVLLFCYIFGWGIAAGAAIACGVLALLFIIRFFRCPKRVALIDEDLVIAPADGKIVIVDRRVENEYLKRECIQVSIFMSIFNVHVNYYPVGGVVRYYKYHPGNYIIENHPKASEKNERTSIAVETGSGTTVLFRQIAGYIARRIVCYAKEEKRANQCDQVGFIKFGSRVDIFLPEDSQIMIKTGDCVSACQTVIAKLPKRQQ